MSLFDISSYKFFELPENLIAQTPHDPIDESKLLVYNPTTEDIIDSHCLQLPDFLPECVMFTNHTQVIKAKIPTDHGDLLIVKIVSPTQFVGLMKGAKKGKSYKSENYTITGLAQHEDGLLFQTDGDVYEMIETLGNMPLPPYISDNKSTYNSYQNPFGDTLGSIASPTASLHFTPRLLSSLYNKGIIHEKILLHVGLGTFKPVKTNDIREHDMHYEEFSFDSNLFERIAQYKNEGKKIFAVGTTVARLLESLPTVYHSHAIELSLSTNARTFRESTIADEGIRSRIGSDNTITGSTNIFMYPGKTWQIVDILKTNFHLPGSTLIMLVASFIGYENIQKVYQHAITHNYRFYSFGDGGLYWKKEN